MFPGDYEPNALTRLLARQRAAGTPLIDLTESNPAVHGLSPDPLCLAPATASGLRRYRPEPRGAPAAREAVAGYYRERGISTLTAPEEFAAGIARLVAALQDQHPGAAV